MPEEIDMQRVEQFAQRAFGDVKGQMVVLMCNLGDRLGLFKELSKGPARAEELAERTGLNTRYVEEWLNCLTCAEYIEYDPDRQKFTLPPEHAAVVAHEGGPAFFGGMYQEMPALWSVLPQLTEAFQTGGGVPIEAYDDCWWHGMERFTGTWFENFLLQEWIPEADGIERKLEGGGHIADVGCGRGKALVKIAEAYPEVTAVGYDLFDENVAAARERAEQAGVTDRIRFEKADVTRGLPESFDVIMTFDAAHDFSDPAAAFREIHSALKPDGSYLVLEFRVDEDLEGNIGPKGAVFYGISTAYCMTTALEDGGAGLGTCGLHESAMRNLCDEAGFESVDVVPFEDPFNILYQAQA